MITQPSFVEMSFECDEHDVHKVAIDAVGKDWDEQLTTQVEHASEVLGKDFGCDDFVTSYVRWELAR